MDFGDENQPISSEDLKKLKVEELKKILRDGNQPVTGKKADLLLRCRVLLERPSTSSSTNIQGSSLPDKVLVSSLSSKADVTYEVLEAETASRTWNTDLRNLPPFNFIQLYDYLVLKTEKYDHSSIRTSGYKKLKAYQFFKEGHIKNLCVTEASDGPTFVKGEVLASMKQVKYKILVSFSHLGDVLKAVCQCPAGRGNGGLGHCNHVGGVLFAVEDFCNKGLRQHAEPVSCTSKLCCWNVPRNIKTDPKPVDDINITKFKFGREANTVPKSSLYDPRAPSQRNIDPQALSTLSQELTSELGASSYFLFYDITPNIECKEVEIDSCFETVPEHAPDFVIEEKVYDLPFNDEYDISTVAFKSMISCYQEHISDAEIETVERITRGQSNNDTWRDLKRTKLTASNFHSAARRQKEPDKLLKAIMYIKDQRKLTPALEYGIQHEKEAISCYVAQKVKEGNIHLKVFEVGTIISKERPGFGASLDSKVYDPMARGKKTGGLEVKCPYSKRGMTVLQACEDNTFCLGCDGEGFVKLKPVHKYFYQVQGQMYVCNIEWVDFVVWLGGDTIFIQRVYYDEEWWHHEVLPKLDYFYKNAFLPEVFTRRVERGFRLYRHNGWKSFKQAQKNRKCKRQQ